MKVSKFKILIIFSLIFFLNSSTKIFAHPDDLIIKSVSRISHPDYFIKSLWMGNQTWSLFNQDHTRIILFENKITHPDKGITGRGFVWGKIEDFKSWIDFDDYNTKIKPIETQMSGSITYSWSILWSKIPGEEGIIYITRNDGWLWRYNTDTGIADDWIYCNADNGWAITGWTDSNTIMLVDSVQQGLGWYELDVVSRTVKYHSNDELTIYPPDLYWKNPTLFHELPLLYRYNGHASLSPSESLFVDRCGTTSESEVCVNKLNPDGTMELLGDGSPDGKGTHFSWSYSEDWFISSPGLGIWGDYPHLVTRTIYQTHFDPDTGVFENTPLVTHTSPGRWEDGNKKNNQSELNFSAVPGATLSRNGKMMIFMGTDGLYSVQDYNAKGVEPWGMNGAFLVEFESESTNYPPNGVIDTPILQPGDITITVGDLLNFTGTGTDNEPDLPFTYLWDFGEGSGISNYIQEDPGLVQFNNPGTFIVTFTVTDAQGFSDPTPDKRSISVLDSTDETKKYYWLEAELAESLSSPMEVANDNNASGGRYIEVPNGQGNTMDGTGAEAVYTVNITQTGEYILWGRVIAPSSSDDSFFVNVGSSTNEAWGVEIGNNWIWDKVNIKDEVDPVKYNLTTGEQTITIGQREDGTKLDKLLLTNDMDYLPIGNGGSVLPFANDDFAIIHGDTPVTINVIANDVATEGTIDPATVTIIENSVKGISISNGDGTVTYSPYSAFTDTDTFTYTVQDDLRATSNEATVTIKSNQSPKAVDDSVETDKYTPVIINVVINDSDADGTIVSATVAIVNNSVNGTAVSNGDGTVIYTPDTDYTGTDTFTYSVQDDFGATSNEATVTIIINDPNRYYWLEAEAAESITSPMQMADDSFASGGKYIWIPEGQGNKKGGKGGEAVYTVNVTKEGEYILWGRVIAPSSSDDSFFVKVGSGAQKDWSVVVGSSWQWDEVNNIKQNIDPVKYYLTTGNQTIIIGHREDGTKLDKLLLTNDMSYIPAGFGGS